MRRMVKSSIALIGVVVFGGCQSVDKGQVNSHSDIAIHSLGHAAMDHLPEAVIYKSEDFAGDHTRTHLGYDGLSSDSRDSIGSIIVVSGTWRFCSEHGFRDCIDAGPGFYKDIQSLSMNKPIASFMPVIQKNLSNSAEQSTNKP